jgi:hypothetical protein
MVQKLESCYGIHKEARCSLTQQVKVFVCWPTILLDAMSLRKFTQPVFQEKPDVRVDDRRLHPCRTKTSVNGLRSPRRKPDWMRGSGRPVMRNLTFGIPSTNRPMTERMADCGSSSTHSSNASMTMTVEMSDELRGPTINVTIWLQSDSCAISGFDWRRGRGSIEIWGICERVGRREWGRCSGGPCGL